MSVMTGPGHYKFPEYLLNPQWKSQFCSAEFLSYLKCIPIKQVFVKLLRTAVWETLHFIVFWDFARWLSIFNMFSNPAPWGRKGPRLRIGQICPLLTGWPWAQCVCVFKKIFTTYFLHLKNGMTYLLLCLCYLCVMKSKWNNVCKTFGPQ